MFESDSIQNIENNVVEEKMSRKVSPVLYLHMIGVIVAMTSLTINQNMNECKQMVYLTKFY